MSEEDNLRRSFQLADEATWRWACYAMQLEICKKLKELDFMDAMYAAAHVKVPPFEKVKK